MTTPGPRALPSPFGQAGAAGRAGVRVHTATDGKDMLINSPDGWEVSFPWLWWEGNGDDGGEGSDTVLGNPPPGALGWRPNLPAAVTRATSLICDGLAGMPWQVFRGQDRLDTPDWIADPQAKRVDQRIQAGPVPEWRKSAVEFRASLIRSMLWFGEGIIYVPNRNIDGSPAPPVWQIHPWDVDIEGGRWTVNGTMLEPGELIVMRGMAHEGPRGIGILWAHWRDIGLAMEMRRFSQNMFSRGVPLGYLKVNAPQLTTTKARELQRDWMAAHGGINKRIAVLNATTDFHPLQLDPASLQLAQTRDYSNLDIALIFGVPPYMLGIKTDTQTYANISSRLVEFAEFTLLPVARKIESALDAEFPRGTNMRINLDALRRADTTTRYQAYAIAIQAGFMTVEEVRALENLPPLAPGPVQSGEEVAQ